MIFVDTSFLFPLFVANDDDHLRVREVVEGVRHCRLRDLLVTTNHVVFETVTLMRKRVGHREAVFASERLLSEKMVRVHQATPEEERAALEYFAKHADKYYSAVDCLSFVVMDRLGIEEAWASTPISRTVSLRSQVPV
jgi:predicted nucleic acid-binding protein